MLSLLFDYVYWNKSFRWQTVVPKKDVGESLRCTEIWISWRTIQRMGNRSWCVEWQEFWIRIGCKQAMRGDFVNVCVWMWKIWWYFVNWLREWESGPVKRDVFNYRRGEFEICEGNIWLFSDSARVLWWIWGHIRPFSGDATMKYEAVCV